MSVTATPKQHEAVNAIREYLEYNLKETYGLELAEFNIEVRDVGYSSKPKPIVRILATSTGNIYVQHTYQIFVHVRGRIDWNLYLSGGYKHSNKYYTKIFWSNWRRMKRKQGGN